MNDELDDPSLPLVATELVPDCAVCGGSRHTPFASGRDYELLTCRNTWTFVRCDVCAHVWLNPRPAVDALPTVYPPHYYAYDYEARVNRAARWGKSIIDRRKLAGILARCERTPRTYLDIGCGSGRYLRAMAAHGLAPADVHGIELQRTVVDGLVREAFSVQQARVETAELEAGSIDLATMFHVLEHVDAPQSVVRRVAGWLAPGGVLAIETPNIESLDQRLFADGFWGGYHIPRHWHLFTAATLTRLLTRADLRPMVTLYQTGHSFWMYSFHHRLRYGARARPRLAKRFDPFRNVVPLAAFTAFDALRARLGARTSAMLVLAEKPR